MTALGAAAAALASWRIHMHALARDLPLISGFLADDVPQDGPRIYEFHMSGDTDRWAIYGARIGRGWRRRIAPTTGEPRDSFYRFSMHFQGAPWVRALEFDRPDTAGRLAIHPDTPESFWVRFDVRLKSSPRRRRCVLVRITANE
ncbi:MAG: hypothetical protein OXN96_19210 [Bryobacterales bacterium]|nr:hypothetical protein [Bryobacterales bacterium]